MWVATNRDDFDIQYNKFCGNKREYRRLADEEASLKLVSGRQYVVSGLYSIHSESAYSTTVWVREKAINNKNAKSFLTHGLIHLYGLLRQVILL